MKGHLSEDVPAHLCPQAGSPALLLRPGCLSCAQAGSTSGLQHPEVTLQEVSRHYTSLWVVSPGIQDKECGKILHM